MQESDAHLLLDISPCQGCAELLEGNHLVVVPVGFHDGALRDTCQLIVRNVRTDHHVQHGQKLLFRDSVVIIQIIHTECKAKFLFTAIKFIFPVFLDGTETSQDSHELTEINIFVVAFLKECVDNPIAERIYSQFWNTNEVLPAQGSRISFIKASKSTVQSFNLTWRKSGFVLYVSDFLLLEHQRGLISHPEILVNFDVSITHVWMVLFTQCGDYSTDLHYYSQGSLGLNVTTL